MPRTALRSKYDYYLHFMGEGSEGQRLGDTRHTAKPKPQRDPEARAVLNNVTRCLHCFKYHCFTWSRGSVSPGARHLVPASGWYMKEKKCHLLKKSKGQSHWTLKEDRTKELKPASAEVSCLPSLFHPVLSPSLHCSKINGCCDYFQIWSNRNRAHSSVVKRTDWMQMGGTSPAPPSCVRVVTNHSASFLL